MADTPAPADTAALAERAASGEPERAERADHGEESDPFVAPATMDAESTECFPGDRGVLDPEVRRVLARLLQRRFLLADRHGEDWAVLLANQPVIESRLHELFLRLIVDPARGVAYKQQVRTEEFDVPILLRDEAYSRAETLVLVYLRTVYQRESTAGEPEVRVDVEEIEQTVLSYFSEADGDVAGRQKKVRSALGKLRQEGLIEEESEGRFRISPLVEIVLSAEGMRSLNDWLREQNDRAARGLPRTAVGEEPDAEHAPEHDEFTGRR
ncbi:DUF4194 domain-containing protein, partial [Leucobacter sp. M11]|uniref:DUF4194 domain-containing protein n=1 Tax=Leucobacter sp. M11 TaxID=2993565 RepID=UPI002D7F9CDF